MRTIQPKRNLEFVIFVCFQVRDDTVNFVFPRRGAVIRVLEADNKFAFFFHK